MRTVDHTDKLYIQIIDDNPDTIGLSFNDSYENHESIDPNAFDKDTMDRVAFMLAHACIYVDHHIATMECMNEL